MEPIIIALIVGIAVMIRVIAGQMDKARMRNAHANLGRREDGIL